MSDLKTFRKEVAAWLKENCPASMCKPLTSAEMGWACLTIPEAYGGLDFGYTGLGQVLEETGRTLTASPLVSTVLLGATAI